MEAPSVEEIIEWSDFSFAEYGYEDTARLERLIPLAESFVVWATGRTLADVPPQFEPAVEQAILLLVQNYVVSGTQEIAETLADFGLIASFSAGSYSETRRSADDARKLATFTVDPRLTGLLLPVMTDDALDQWLELVSGKPRPAYAFVEFFDTSAAYPYSTWSSLSDYPRDAGQPIDFLPGY